MTVALMPSQRGELPLASDSSPLPHHPNHLGVRNHLPVAFNRHPSKAWPMHPVMPPASPTPPLTPFLVHLTPPNTMTTPRNTTTDQDPPPSPSWTFASHPSRTDCVPCVPLANVPSLYPNVVITVDCVEISFAMLVRTIVLIYHWREFNLINLSGFVIFVSKMWIEEITLV